MLCNPINSLQELYALEDVKHAIRANKPLMDSAQERYCQNVLHVIDFFSLMDGMDGKKLIDKTMIIITELRHSMMELNSYHPMHALYMYCMQPNVFNKLHSYHDLSIISMCLISTCWFQNGFSLKDFMIVFRGPNATVPKDPYTEVNLQYLYDIVYFFDCLAFFDRQYHNLLVADLTTDPQLIAYTSRLLSNRNEFYKYFIQYRSGVITAAWQMNSPLNDWLMPRL